MRRRPKAPTETTVLPEQGGPVDAGAPAESFWNQDLDAAPVPPQTQQSEPLSAEPEYTVVRVRRHGRHLVFPVLVLFVVAWLAGYYVGALPELWMNVAAGAGAVVVALLLGVGPLLGWLTRRTVITTRRVIVHRGFFVRHRSEVSLMRVREVRSRQNLAQRMWGSGDVDLFVGTEATRVYDVPRVSELHAALRELSERSYDEQQRLGGFAY